MRETASMAIAAAAGIVGVCLVHQRNKLEASVAELKQELQEIRSQENQIQERNASSWQGKTTTMIDQFGKEHDVGVLVDPAIPNPTTHYKDLAASFKAEKYLFISHTGADGCKELFARPTRYFVEDTLWKATSKT